MRRRCRGRVAVGHVVEDVVLDEHRGRTAPSRLDGRRDDRGDLVADEAHDVAEQWRLLLVPGDVTDVVGGEDVDDAGDR